MGDWAQIEPLFGALRERAITSVEELEAWLADISELSGAMTVRYHGEELTLPQAAKHLEEPDRSVRQEVWELVTARRLQDKDALEDLYDKMVALRTQIAVNAGFENYRDYAFRRRRRFDYTPEDCFRFHAGVERATVPLVRQILEHRQRLLGVDRLRPWDVLVDPRHRPPLRPFATMAELIAGTEEVFRRVDSSLGDLI